jgi:hypothetical protein
MSLPASDRFTKLLFPAGPGLNAMANHGYLPHNGVGTIEDFIMGTQEAFGMGQLTDV